MASEEVKAEHDQLAQIATGFSNESEAIAQMLQTVRSGMEKMQDTWEGRGSAAFFAEMQSEILPAVQRLQQVLTDGSEVTKQISQTFQQADEEAASPFQSAVAV